MPPPMHALVHQFPAPVLRMTEGMRMHYVPIPHDIAEALVASGTRRVIGTMNGQPINRALHGNGDGGWRLMLGRAALREVGAQYGDTVIIALQSDPTPNVIDLPQELTEALAQDEEAAERFYGMTPGRQRSLAYFVTSAKRRETRIRRAVDLAHKLRTHALHSDLLRNR